LEALRAIGDYRADVADPDHAERLAADLDAGELVALPFSRPERRHRLRDVARNESSSVSACSAVVMLLRPACSFTTMPRLLAASTSMLSTPMPHADHFERGAAR